MAKQQTTDGRKVVASNRRARRNYTVVDTFECGIVLTGSEVKSLRGRQADLDGAYARWARSKHAETLYRERDDETGL